MTKYNVLRSNGDDNTELKVVSSKFTNQGAALKAARKWQAKLVQVNGSWVDTFYVALLEAV